MTDPREVPFGAVLLADVAVASGASTRTMRTCTERGLPSRPAYFDVRAFGINGITGDAGDELVEPHHERDDEGNLTDGHEELFAVMSGHAVFTVDGAEVDAPAGMLVFVRDPALIRSARATVDGTAILAIGGHAGAPARSLAGNAPGSPERRTASDGARRRLAAEGHPAREKGVAGRRGDRDRPAPGGQAQDGAPVGAGLHRASGDADPGPVDGPPVAGDVRGHRDEREAARASGRDREAGRLGELGAPGARRGEGG